MGKRLMRYVFAACCLLAGSAQGQAAVVSFGTGSNQFQMEFVTIGNPGNAADTTGAPNLAGAVGYTYGIGKFEVSEDMITKFNASPSLQITKDTSGTKQRITTPITVSTTTSQTEVTYGPQP